MRYIQCTPLLLIRGIMEIYNVLRVSRSATLFRHSVPHFALSVNRFNFSGLSFLRDWKTMENYDLKKEENYKEFLRLQENPDYLNVTFDEQSGGVCAIHKEHCFDKQMGPFGYRRGQYELDVARILQRTGAVVLLESEFPKGKGVKAFDARINGIASEIKTIEQNGRWAIRTKIHSAISQGAELLVLYYPDSALFSEEKIRDGWIINLSPNQPETLKRIIAVQKEGILEILKPPG